MKKDIKLAITAGILYGALLTLITYTLYEDTVRLTAEKAELQIQVAALNGIYGEKNEFCEDN